ncbi:9214_t:CDS:2, partial [Funneliformis geosporum]
MDENAVVKAENAKLRCVLEEYEARFTRLEQRNKEKTNFIAKMDDDIKEIKQSSANASSIENSNNVIQTSLRNHDENENNTKTMNIVHDQEKISLEVSVQKMLERLNEDVSQRESDSGLDKTARSQIYNEMKPYLSGVSDEYLRKITSKVRKINKLFGYDYDPITLKKIK